MSHRLKYLLVLVLSFCLWVPALAQKVSFEAATPAIVSVDEPFRIEFVLNAKPDHFTPPASFGEFEVLAGPSTAQGPVSYTHLDVYKRQLKDQLST